MKQILMTDRLYKRLKTIAVEQDERIKVMPPPSPGAGVSNSTDGLGNASDRALAVAAESGDMAEYRRIREKQQGG